MGTITHDRPTVSIDDVTVDAGQTAKFKVTLSQGEDYPVSLQFQTQDGTALEGTDYLGTTSPARVMPPPARSERCGSSRARPARRSACRR